MDAYEEREEANVAWLRHERGCKVCISGGSCPEGERLDQLCDEAAEKVASAPCQHCGRS